VLDKGSFLIDNNGTNPIHTSKNIMVPFNYNFNATPTDINCTVISSGSYSFSAEITQIFSHGFQVKVTRKDNLLGHPKKVKLNWTLMSSELVFTEPCGKNMPFPEDIRESLCLCLIVHCCSTISFFLKINVKELGFLGGD